MVVASHRCFFSHPLHLSSLSTTQPTLSQALGVDVLGDYEAIDPFPVEITSGFAEKVLGNVDTEHRILIPNLSSLSCPTKLHPNLSSTAPDFNGGCLEALEEEIASGFAKKVLGNVDIEHQILIPNLSSLSCPAKLHPNPSSIALDFNGGRLEALEEGEFTHESINQARP